MLLRDIGCCCVCACVSAQSVLAAAREDRVSLWSEPAEKETRVTPFTSRGEREYTMGPGDVPVAPLGAGMPPPRQGDAPGVLRSDGEGVLGGTAPTIPAW